MNGESEGDSPAEVVVEQHDVNRQATAAKDGSKHIVDKALEAKQHGLKVPREEKGVHRVSYYDHGAHKTKNVALPTKLAARAATLGSKWNWINWTWGFVFTMVLPAVGSIIWFGLIPVGPATGDFKDVAVWALLVNPATMAFLCFLLVSLFLTSLEESQPWRPLRNYIHIPVIVYITQMLMPGLVVILYGTFELLALAAIGQVFVVTLLALRLTPHTWFDCDKQRFDKTFKAFRKVSIVFMVFAVVLAAYMVANVEAQGSVAQGFIVVALGILTFIFKKILLAFTDPIGIETAMLIAGFWLENLTDVFITLAFPIIDDYGPAFAIIFLQRAAENIGVLGFQLDIWFKFRVWIKGKFKKDQAVAIEEDLPEYQDDRGHSASHPGYRRRQLRFLVLKIFSQVASYVYFLLVTPVLRFGPNKRRFAFSSKEQPDDKLEDSVLGEDIQFISRSQYLRAIAFTVVNMVAALVTGAFCWLFMHHYFPDIIRSIRERYNVVVVQYSHYGLVLSVMLVNALIATSYIQVYYRVYFM